MRLVNEWEGKSSLVAFDGREIECRGTSWVQLVVDGVPLSARVIVVDSILNGIGVVLGMDVIDRLGGATVRKGKATFGRASCAVGMGPGGGNGERIDEGLERGQILLSLKTRIS